MRVIRIAGTTAQTAPPPTSVRAADLAPEFPLGKGLDRMAFLRLVRFLDDLAEVLLFDVLLASRARRRGLALLSCGGIALYLVITALTPPPPIPSPWWPGTTEPIVARWDAELPVEARAIVNGHLPDLTRAQREAFLVPLAADLDRMVAATRGPLLPVFARMPHRDFADVAPVALALRGYWRLQAHDSARGVEDLIAAGRLARAVGVPVRESPALMTAVSGVRAERAVLALTERAVRSRWTTAAQERRLLREMERRSEEVLSYEDAIRADIAWSRHVLETFGRTGRWIHAAGSKRLAALRLWLPREAAARDTAARALAGELAAVKEAELAAVLRGEEPAVNRVREEHLARGEDRPRCLGYDVPLDTGVIAGIAGCVSKERGHELSRRLLVESQVRCQIVNAEEFRKRDREVERLELLLAAPGADERGGAPPSIR